MDEKRQRRCSICWSCLVFLVLLATDATASSSWWLLGVSSISNTTTHDPIAPVNCSNVVYPGHLTEKQVIACSLDNKAIRFLSIGVRKGIVECQKKFNESLWNCTAFEGVNLFGSFVNGNTRETAIINLVLTAGAARSIAEACRQEKLRPYCTCQSDGKPTVSNGSFVFHDCNDDTDAAANFLLKFLGITNATTHNVRQLTDNHNTKTALMIAKKTTKQCRCHGTSGSCTIKTCYHRNPEIDEVGSIVRQDYTVALKVIVKNNRLARSDGHGDDLPNDHPVYSDPSPDFCVRDAAKGTLGTADRPCKADPNKPGNCNVICCGRGAYYKETVTPMQCCEFVFCCRVECRVCGTERTREYFCNA